MNTQSQKNTVRLRRHTDYRRKWRKWKWDNHSACKSEEDDENWKLEKRKFNRRNIEPWQ